MTSEKKRGRPEKEQTLESLTIRVEGNIIESIDLIARYMSKKAGVSITRAQVVRKIITQNIDKYVDEISALDPQYTNEIFVKIEEKTPGK